MERINNRCVYCNRGDAWNENDFPKFYGRPFEPKSRPLKQLPIDFFLKPTDSRAHLKLSEDTSDEQHNLNYHFLKPNAAPVRQYTNKRKGNSNQKTPSELAVARSQKSVILFESLHHDGSQNAITTIEETQIASSFGSGCSAQSLDESTTNVRNDNVDLFATCDLGQWFNETSTTVASTRLKRKIDYNDKTLANNITHKNRKTVKSATAPTIMGNSVKANAAPSNERLQTYAGIDLQDIHVEYQDNAELMELPRNETVLDTKVATATEATSPNEECLESSHAGQLVWAQWSKSPFWPAIVHPDDEGITANEKWVQVMFLGDQRKTAWIKSRKSLLPFKGLQDYESIRENVLNNKLKSTQLQNPKKAFKRNSSKSWTMAVAEADILSLVVVEHRHRFHKQILTNYFYQNRNASATNISHHSTLHELDKSSSECLSESTISYSTFSSMLASTTHTFNGHIDEVLHQGSQGMNQKTTGATEHSEWINDSMSQSNVSAVLARDCDVIKQEFKENIVVEGKDAAFIEAISKFRSLLAPSASKRKQVDPESAQKGRAAELMKITEAPASHSATPQSLDPGKKSPIRCDVNEDAENNVCHSSTNDLSLFRLIVDANCPQGKAMRVIERKICPNELKYIRIKANRPVPPAKVPVNKEWKGSICECSRDDVDPCGPNNTKPCYNYALFIECNEHCPAQEKCQNRHFEKRLYAKTQVKLIESKGWGSIAVENIKRNSFIIECVGEVINRDELNNRLPKRIEDYLDGYVNFNILKLGDGLYIDAVKRGNEARFIDHSCEPNCYLQKWIVAGRTRLGVFAAKDIPMNTELTIDFNCDLNKFGVVCVCHCGANACTGYIGFKSNIVEKL